MEKNTQVSRLNVPMIRQPFRLSMTALGLILATLLLGGLLAVSTIHNINREQVMMEKLLLQQGETIIRSIGTGVRAAMTRSMTEKDLIAILETEKKREDDILYIRIVDANGSIFADAGSREFSPSGALKQSKRIGKSFTTLDTDGEIFEIAQPFDLINNHLGAPTIPPQTGRGQQLTILVGLLTREFDVARQHDVQHNLFMAALLFLVGITGLYFLFLYERMRVANSTLKNMKLYTANVIESIPAGLVTLDAADTVVSVNRKAEEILGNDFKEMNGRSIGEVFQNCPFDNLQVNSELLEIDSECVHFDGSSVPVRISASKLLDHNGEAIGSVLILKDMSLLRHMEQQLERSRRMAALGKMAAGIAHEIRNPLGTLKGFAQFFGAQADENSESRHYADLMVSEVDRLNQTISALLQFARPREPQFENVNLDALITKTVALMETECEHHNIKLHWSRDTGIEVVADPDLLLQVLLNLLKNSISATPPEGEISLTAIREGREAVIIVHDTGKGMTREEQERMFDPFFTTKKTGTGLGLTVSLQIIEEHNGRFEVSTAPNNGTDIRIVLPFPQGGRT